MTVSITSPGTAAVASAPSPSRRVFDLFQLPAEITDSIVSYLEPLDLARLSLTCRELRDHALRDRHWRRHVLANLPGNPITTPYPCKSWRQLFIAHDQHWFLTRNKIWFSDCALTGQMALARYDQRRGCIELYQLLAVKARDGSEPWLGNPEVHIHYFEPKIKLHLDRPVLQFNAASWESLTHTLPDITLPRGFFREQPTPVNGSDSRYSAFELTKPLEEAELSSRMAASFPYGSVWPPPALPSQDRVLGHPRDISVASNFGSVMDVPAYRPCRISEASQSTFQIRQWAQFGGLSPVVFRYAEEILTYSTLDPSLYTPTAERPYRGIWVGDYSMHGCEFVVINQFDDENEEAPQTPLVKREDESDEEFKQRFLKERVHRGSLEAIKLTGDPNVPRGERTFIADDLGEDGLIGIAQDPPFSGARVVRSRGHVAGAGFVHDGYIESQLILVSFDRLAQYWVKYNHISFFERIDINKLLVP